HEIEQLVVRPFRVCETQLRVRRSLLAQYRPHWYSHCLDELLQPLTSGRALEIFDDHRLFAALPDHREHVARPAAIGVVVDRDSHRCAPELIAWSIRASLRSQRASHSPQSAPRSCATTKPGRSIGRMPENVFVNERAIVTAGLANEVEAVNQ